MKRILPLVQAMGIGAALAAALPSAAFAADGGSEFLASLAGQWRGRGSAKLPGREKPERVACQVTNVFDATSMTLSISGNCASTQGKSQVSGSLKLVGDSVEGSFLGDLDGATATRSSGSVSAIELVVSTSFMIDATGNLIQTRQVIRRNANGFSSEFYLFDNATKQFEKSGSLEFSAS